MFCLRIQYLTMINAEKNSECLNRWQGASIALQTNLKHNFIEEIYQQTGPLT